jgi:hypothetical protein
VTLRRCTQLLAVASSLAAHLALAQPEAGAQAEAQPEPTPPPAAETDEKQLAKLHFERGLELAGAGNWDAALAEFTESYARFPTRGALKNRSIVLKQLYRYDEALSGYEALRSEFSDLPDADRSFAEREIADLSRRVGYLLIAVSEPQASVTIDGRASGATPLPRPARLAVGSHLVRVSKSGFLPFETRVELASVETKTISARLEPLTRAGRLRLSEARGAPATVFVDGVEMGATPWEGTLGVGAHVVWLKGTEPDLGTQPALVDVRQNELSGAAWVLEPLSAALRVEVEPAQTTIVLDGVPITSGRWEGSVRAGGHRVELSAAGYLTVGRDIALEKAEHRTERFRLEPDPTSAKYHAEHPPRIVLGLSLGGALGSSLGGSAFDNCSGSCRRAMPLGARFELAAGYQLGVGLGASLDLGYRRVGQRIRRRELVAQPVNKADNPGLADDQLTLGLWSLGASVFYHAGRRLTFTARLGGGVAVGRFRDERTAALSIPGSGSPSADYSVALSESSTSSQLYGLTAALVGWPLNERWELNAGVIGELLVATRSARWDANRARFIASCGAEAQPDCSSPGIATFKPEPLQSATLLLGSLALGVRYAF